MRLDLTALAALAAVAASALALAGCPTVRLGEVAVKEGSASRTGFTVTARVTVEELDETTGEGKSPSEGRGVIALHLPEGWSVAGARIRVPGEAVDRALVPTPLAAVAFAETFPTVPGQWWAFATPSQKIAQGTWEYPVELDVAVAKKAKGGVIGVAAAVLQDAAEDLPAPREFQVELKGGGTTLVEVPAAPTPG